ncbi:MAG: type II secretion system protein [Planctomycetota bacterium]
MKIADSGPRSTGFSLVELLVAIAVVSILLSLLLPTVSRVRGASRATSCASNLRQMTITVQQYALTHRAYPVAVRADNSSGSFEIHNWDWVTDTDDNVIRPGAMWAFSDRPDEILQCPSYVGPPNANDPYTGYNYNTTYVGGEGSTVLPGWTYVRASARPSQCSRAAHCAVFGCGGRHNGTNKFMRAPENSVEGNLTQIYAGGQAFRHQGGTNAAYLDGRTARTNDPHAGIHATDDLLSSFMAFPANGFLSPDDRAYRTR